MNNIIQMLKTKEVRPRWAVACPELYTLKPCRLVKTMSMNLTTKQLYKFEATLR